MLSIFLQLFCCAHQKASSGKSQNICQQLCSFVDMQLDCKEYFLLKKSTKSLYVCVVIRDEGVAYSYWNFEIQESAMTIFSIVYSEDILATKIRTTLHIFSKSFNVDNVFIFTTKDDLNHLCKEDVQEKLITGLKELTYEKSGPKYHFKGYVTDEISLIARTINKNNEWEKQSENFNVDSNLYIRLDSDKDFYFVFDIDLDYFNFNSLLKNYIVSMFDDKNGMFHKFLTNFDFVYSFNIKKLVDRIISDKKELSDLKKLSREVRKKKLLLKGEDLSITFPDVAKYKCLEWIDKISEQYDCYKKFIKEIEELEELEGERFNMFLVFMFSISRQEIFKLLLAHVLSSESNLEKFYIVEILFQLNVIDRKTSDNLLQRGNVQNLQSWKEKIDDKFLAPLLRLTNTLPFHNTLIRYLFIILFIKMNMLEKDCKEIKDCLRTYHSDCENLLMDLINRKEKPFFLLIETSEISLEKVSSVLYWIILDTSSDYEKSFTNYVYKELSKQCKKIMNFYENPTRRIKKKEKEQIAALYKKMKSIVAISSYETL